MVMPPAFESHLVHDRLAAAPGPASTGQPVARSVGARMLPREARGCSSIVPGTVEQVSNPQRSASLVPSVRVGSGPLGVGPTWDR